MAVDARRDHIERVWTDMRPRSLREATERHAPSSGGHG